MSKGGNELNDSRKLGGKGQTRKKGRKNRKSRGKTNRGKQRKDARKVK